MRHKALGGWNGWEAFKSSVVRISLWILVLECAAREPEEPPFRVLPNLLYNASFEQADWFEPKQAERWLHRANAERVATNGVQGAMALRVRGAGYTLQRDVPLLPEVEYRLSAWMRARTASGWGVQVAYLGDGHVMHATERVGGAEGWRRAEVRFRLSPPAPSGHVRLIWDVGEEGEGWFDDVTLEPVDGIIPTAPPPVLCPPGGKFRGPAMVVLTSELARATIRYTTDGRVPTAWSTEYRAPIWLTYSARLRARVFHAAYRDGEAEAVFEILPDPSAGVPFVPPGWGRDVRDWWKEHPYNPAASNAFRGAIRSPEPRVDVAEMRRRYPQSSTAGIAEALAALPPEGGTLWFPKAGSPYFVTAPATNVVDYYPIPAVIPVLRRSRLHFLSDGATIRSGAPLFGFASMDYADRRVMERPVRDFYFRGLTFDGAGASSLALTFHHAHDILVDQCAFVNFVPASSLHPGAIIGTAKTDNLWCRDCRFESGHYGVYLDGVHGGGFLRCRFGRNLRAGGILIMTNNDMATLSATPRTANYVVVIGCEFEGGRAAMLFSNANTLVQGNRAIGYETFFGLHGRGRSSVAPGVSYEIYGNRIVGNTLRDCRTLAMFEWNCTSHRAREPNVVMDNTAVNLDCLLRLNPQFPDAVISHIEVSGNRVSGVRRPQVRAAADALERIRDVRVLRNAIPGGGKPALMDLTGKVELTASGILVE